MKAQHETKQWIEDNDGIHAFEAAGLGPGPYEYVGMWSKDELEEGQEVCPDVDFNFKCEYCDTGLTNHFVVKNVENRHFVVGSDCVIKSGDEGIISKVRAELKRRTAARQAVRTKALIQDAKAYLKRESVAVACSRLPHPRNYTGKTLYDYYAYMIENAYTVKGRKYIADQILEMEPAEKWLQSELPASLSPCKVEKAAEPPKNREWVGEPGKRVDFGLVTLIRKGHWTRPSFSGYGEDSMTAYVFETEDDNLVVWKTSSYICLEDEDSNENPIQKGQKVYLTGTIKEHSEYNDEKQTIVVRCSYKAPKKGE